MSVQASLSKLRPPEPLLQVFPPERPVGSHAGLCGGRVPGYLTSRGYQEPGAAVRFQTWDVSSGFNNPQLYFRPPPHFLIKWGRGTSPQCLAHIGFIKCWPLSRSRETSRPRPGLPLTFRKWQFGRVVTFRATQRGGGPSPPWEPGREAGGPGYPRAPAVHSIAPGGWPGAAPPSGPHVGRSASLPESPAQVCSRAWRLPTAAMPPGTGE